MKEILELAALASGFTLLCLLVETLRTRKPMKRFTKTLYGFCIRCFGGWLVIYKRDVFVIWWSTDATPPTKRERNGVWIFGNYGKWARSKFA